MVTDQYSHIIDEDRKINAELMESVFYQGKREESGENVTVKSDNQGTVITPEMIAELMKNPAAAAVLTALLQTSK